MLNELYSIYQGLEAAGESPAIKHNDIQSPGMGTTFRVMLDEDGQVSSAKLMSKEQIKNSWSLGNGKKNQFPAIKVVYPLLAEGHADYLAWKEEVSKPSEAEYSELIERLSQKYPVDLSHIDCWPSYRKQVLTRKEQLTGIKDCEAIYQLFDRYSRTETGVEILEKVADLLIESAQQGADSLSLKAICTVLFGDDVTPKGLIKGGKRVTLMLDCFPQTDIDIYASSRDRVVSLSQALFTAESKANKKTRNAECALTGDVGQVVYDIFPNEKLSVVGSTTLFAKNATTSGPTVKRYNTSGGAAFSVSDKLSQKLAASKREFSRLFDFKIFAEDGLSRHPGFDESTDILNELWPEMTKDKVDASELCSKAIRNELLRFQVKKDKSKWLLLEEQKQGFQEVSAKYRIIDSETATVIVDKSLVEKLEMGIPVNWQEIQESSVQLWMSKIENLKLKNIRGCKNDDIYSWIDSYEYDASFLGIMGGILNPEAFFKETGGLVS